VHQCITKSFVLFHCLLKYRAVHVTCVQPPRIHA
jgi:hypothetical protein